MEFIISDCDMNIVKCIDIEETVKSDETVEVVFEQERPPSSGQPRAWPDCARSGHLRECLDLAVSGLLVGFVSCSF